MSKREFTVSLDVDGGFGRVVEGETGYYPSAAKSQEDADDMNAISGNSPAEVEAAKACSMFDCWQNFDKIVKAEEERKA